MANLTHRKNGEINDDFNYAIRWHGAPGSTFKGISLMALLDDAGVSKDTWVDCGQTGKTVVALTFVIKVKTLKLKCKLSHRLL